VLSPTACANLVGFSSSPAVFKANQLLPVSDLKLLVRDYPVGTRFSAAVPLGTQTDRSVSVSVSA
jgi:hypothetical protein